MEVFEGRPADLTGRLEKNGSPTICWTGWGLPTSVPTMSPATMEVCKR